MLIGVSHVVSVGISNSEGVLINGVDSEIVGVLSNVNISLCSFNISGYFLGVVNEVVLRCYKNVRMKHPMIIQSVSI